FLQIMASSHFMEGSLISMAFKLLSNNSSIPSFLTQNLLL
ncbi:hypothetical protein ACUXDS_002668, partial [Staphylococcus cohnii]